MKETIEVILDTGIFYQFIKRACDVVIGLDLKILADTVDVVLDGKGE